MPKFEKGHKKKGGRKKGTPNKFTGLKDAFVEAFRNIGAARGLIKWIRKSNENQKVFYMLIARMLPAEMKAQVEGKEILTLNVISAVPRSDAKEKAGDLSSAEEVRDPAELTDDELAAEIRKLKKKKRGKHDKARGAAKGKRKKAKA